jgi:hypothetical protein
VGRQVSLGYWVGARRVATGHNISLLIAMELVLSAQLSYSLGRRPGITRWRRRRSRPTTPGRSARRRVPPEPIALRPAASASTRMIGAIFLPRSERRTIVQPSATRISRFFAASPRKPTLSAISDAGSATSDRELDQELREVQQRNDHHRTSQLVQAHPSGYDRCRQRPALNRLARASRRSSIDAGGS